MKLNHYALLLLVSALLLPILPSMAATPVPKVTGSLPVTSASYPFGAADHTPRPQDLKQMGYVEEEFLIQRLSQYLQLPETGSRDHTGGQCSIHNTLLIRRPIRREKFSGNVAVEMLNPSNRFDLNIGWALSYREFVRKGDAWVGITAKPIAVAALRWMLACRILS